jgi:hypothetical protein
MREALFLILVRFVCILILPVSASLCVTTILLCPYDISLSPCGMTPTVGHIYVVIDEVI